MPGCQTTARVQNVKQQRASNSLTLQGSLQQQEVSNLLPGRLSALWCLRKFIQCLSLVAVMHCVGCPENVRCMLG